MRAYILDTEAHDVVHPHATEIAFIKVGFVDNDLVYLDNQAFEQRYHSLHLVKRIASQR